MIAKQNHNEEEGLLAVLAVPAGGVEELDLLVQDVDPFTCSTGELSELLEAAGAANIKLLLANKPRLAARADRLHAWLAAVADTRRRWNDAIGCGMEPAHALSVVEQWADAGVQVDQQHATRELRRLGATRKQLAYLTTKRVAGCAGERAALLQLRLGLAAARLI
jgi:hypothetical protein